MKTRAYQVLIVLMGVICIAFMWMYFSEKSTANDYRDLKEREWREKTRISDSIIDAQTIQISEMQKVVDYHINAFDSLKVESQLKDSAKVEIQYKYIVKYKEIEKMSSNDIVDYLKNELKDE